MKLNITLKKEEDGFYTASCNELKGCHSQGRTKGEAIANINEAIAGYLASMKKHGEY
jgi:antitoxin HicB